MSDIIGNETVDIDDLVAVVTAWGECNAASTSSFSEIAPFGGNGVVNIDDLVAVITQWGACP